MQIFKFKRVYECYLSYLGTPLYKLSIKIFHALLNVFSFIFQTTLQPNDDNRLKHVLYSRNCATDEVMIES